MHVLAGCCSVGWRNWISFPFQRSDIQGVVCICSSEEDKTAAIPKVSPNLIWWRTLLLFIGGEGISAAAEVTLEEST